MVDRNSLLHERTAGAGQSERSRLEDLPGWSRLRPLRNREVQAARQFPAVVGADRSVGVAVGRGTQLDPDGGVAGRVDRDSSLDVARRGQSSGASDVAVRYLERVVAERDVAQSDVLAEPQVKGEVGGSVVVRGHVLG